MLGDKREWPDGGIRRLMFQVEATAFRRAWGGKRLATQGGQNVWNTEKGCRDLIQKDKLIHGENWSLF